MKDASNITSLNFKLKKCPFPIMNTTPSKFSVYWYYPNWTGGSTDYLCQAWYGLTDLQNTMARISQKYTSKQLQSLQHTAYWDQTWNGSIPQFNSIPLLAWERITISNLLINCLCIHNLKCLDDDISLPRNIVQKWQTQFMI